MDRHILAKCAIDTLSADDLQNIFHHYLENG